jgi:hypothetical protein
MYAKTISPRHQSAGSIAGTAVGGVNPADEEPELVGIRGFANAL